MKPLAILPEEASAMDEMPSPTGAKMLTLLDLLSRHGAGLTVAEAVRRTGFTQNLVFRLLKTMVQMGYASQREDNKAYVLTNRLLDLTGPRMGERSLVYCAHEALRELRDRTGETVQLVIAAGGKALVLEQFRGTHALQVCGEVGMRVPLYSCAPGKVLLAFWRQELLDEWLGSEGRELKPFTPTTLSRREDLVEELESIRRSGYAIDRAEGIEGIHCVAAPIFDAYRQPVGAVTTMAPIARLPESAFARIAAHCHEAAERIESKMLG